LTDDGHKVDQAGRPLEGAMKGIRIPGVCVGDLDSVPLYDRRLGASAQERTHVLLLFAQRRDDSSSQEAGGAGNDYHVVLRIYVN
jgi:hypothetical protein